jgi:hypothetical protein
MSPGEGFPDEPLLHPDRRAMATAIESRIVVFMVSPPQWLA